MQITRHTYFVHSQDPKQGMQDIDGQKSVSQEFLGRERRKLQRLGSLRPLINMPPALRNAPAGGDAGPGTRRLVSFVVRWELKVPHTKKRHWPESSQLKPA
jgi:hypothetical protein